MLTDSEIDDDILVKELCALIVKSELEEDKRIRQEKVRNEVFDREMKMIITLKEQYELMINQLNKMLNGGV